MQHRSMRLHALDAVRAGALLLGVVRHAAMAFLPGAAIWIVADPSRSATLSAAAFTVHTFRMTTFFLIAGFFAHMSFLRRGEGGFIADRAKRILIPLAVGWAMLFPMMNWVTLWAMAHAPASIGPGVSSDDLWGFTLGDLPLGHLWFLYLLALLYIAALLLRRLLILGRIGDRLAPHVDAVARRVLESWFAPALLAAPLVLTMWIEGFRIGWIGVPAPDDGLIPDPMPVVAYAIAFGLGWLIHRQAAAVLNLWRRRWAFNCALAVLLTAFAFVLTGPAPAHIYVDNMMSHLIYAPVVVSAGWAWTFAIIGAAMRFLHRESRVIRYLADASYWIYLAHFPLVILAQGALAPMPWPWFVKFPMIVAVVLTVTLGSYQLFVRHTVIGDILNGKRQPAPAEDDPELAAAKLAARLRSISRR